MGEYYFNPVKALEHHRKNPLGIFTAIKEGHRRESQELTIVRRCPFDHGATHRKKLDHAAAENDYLTAENLEPLRLAINANPQSAGLEVEEAAVLKKTITKERDIDLALVQVASKANLFLSKHLLEPLKNSLQGAKGELCKLMDTIRRTPDAPPYTEDSALERYIFGIKKVSFNAALQFWSMLRLIPGIFQKKYGKQISKDEFRAAVKNIPKLLEDYASSNIGHFYVFKDFTIKDHFDYQRLLGKVYPARSYVEAAKGLAQTMDAPVFDTYSPKYFDLIETPNGHQLVNNEESLRLYAENVDLANRDWSAPETAADRQAANFANKMANMLHLAQATPTLKCPALNIKLKDGKTLFTTINDWLQQLTETFVIPAFDNFSVFRDSNSPV